MEFRKYTSFVQIIIYIYICVYIYILHTHTHTLKVVRNVLDTRCFTFWFRLVCIWWESVELVFTCGVICTESHYANMTWDLTDTVDVYFFPYCAAKHRHTERVADIKTLQNLSSPILLRRRDGIISYVWNAINSPLQHPKHKNSLHFSQT